MCIRDSRSYCVLKKADLTAYSTGGRAGPPLRNRYQFARCALPRLDGAVHVSLPPFARMLTGKDNATGAARQQHSPRRVESRIEEGVTTAHPRIRRPVADVY